MYYFHVSEYMPHSTISPLSPLSPTSTSFRFFTILVKLHLTHLPFKISTSTRATPTKFAQVHNALTTTEVKPQQNPNYADKINAILLPLLRQATSTTQCSVDDFGCFLGHSQHYRLGSRGGQGTRRNEGCNLS